MRGSTDEQEQQHRHHGTGRLGFRIQGLEFHDPLQDTRTPDHPLNSNMTWGSLSP